MAMAKFTVDTANKLFIVKSGVTSFDVQIDLYSDGKEHWISDVTAPGFEFPIRTTGGDPLPGGLNLGAYFFLRNDLGWRIRPDEANHELQINGNIYPENPALPVFVPTVGTFTVTIQVERSSLTQSAGGTSASAVADAVWEKPKSELSVADSAGSVLISTERGVNDTQALIFAR